MTQSLSKSRKALLWILTALSGYCFGAIVSATLAATGITDFPNDRRGEGYFVAMPIVALLCFGFGYIAYRGLAGQAKTLLVAATFGFGATCSLLLLGWLHA